jgi:regulator of sigma E protease
MDLLIGVALVLGVIILVHEWGHFVAARLCGVRVDVFSIGFGPRLFGWKRGATDYRISALPLGGYVRMAGQDPSEIDSVKSTSVPAKEHLSAPYPQLQALAAGSQVSITGAPDELMSKPRWKRAIISFAGPAVNMIFPIFLLGAFFVLFGIPYAAYLDLPVQIVAVPSGTASAQALEPGDKVVSINGIPTPSWEAAEKALGESATNQPVNVELERGGTLRTAEVPGRDSKQTWRPLGFLPLAPVIDQVGAGTPAKRAGIQENDQILSVNGKKVQVWEEFVDQVHSSGGKPLQLEVSRKRQTLSLTITPVQAANEAGEHVYQIGVLNKEKLAYKKVTLAQSFMEGERHTAFFMQKTVEIVGSLFSGRVSVRQLSSVVGISQMAGQAVEHGPLSVVLLMAYISVNLGILNLLPIPILDGGNILLLAIEGGMRRDLSMTFKERFVQVGLVFLLVLFAFVMYNDVVRLLPVHS